MFVERCLLADFGDREGPDVFDAEVTKLDAGNDILGGMKSGHAPALSYPCHKNQYSRKEKCGRWV
jgi:hypothetical protein